MLVGTESENQIPLNKMEAQEMNKEHSDGVRSNEDADEGSDITGRAMSWRKSLAIRP